jgi:hypothetical protein
MITTPDGWWLVQRDGGIVYLHYPDASEGIQLSAFTIHTVGKAIQVYSTNTKNSYILERSKISPDCFSGRGYNFAVEFIVRNMRWLHN